MPLLADLVVLSLVDTSHAAQGQAAVRLHVTLVGVVTVVVPLADAELPRLVVGVAAAGGDLQELAVVGTREEVELGRVGPRLSWQAALAVG